MSEWWEEWGWLVWFILLPILAIAVALGLRDIWNGLWFNV